MSEKDKADENQDKDNGNQDNKSDNKDETPDNETPSPGGKKPAPKEDTDTVTKAEAKKMAEEAEKRGTGRANKELADKVKVLEKEAQDRKDAEFTNTAKRYDMDEEKLNKLGITEASQIVANAALFGKEAKKPSTIIDDGESDGGGETSASDKLKTRYPTMDK